MDISISNEHIKSVNDKTNVFSAMYQISKNALTTKVCKFQGQETNLNKVPEVYIDFAKKISNEMFLPCENVFFQYVHIGKNGEVAKHYDTGVEGYITYKCNICIDGPRNDVIHIGRNQLEINKGDLYCFEANLYKHWLPQNDSPRIHLSYGFIVLPKKLGWDNDSPRMRMATKISKLFVS